ncbi:receptor-type tyrosine-protein phosphatase N2 isoform X2 [Chelonus insularis]|uniref:receptor-type tyrosine-protein phosphatase N2 isoform X2 n=1 Tax=Chelonus insularis TaxID=460826 RepID=UPI00158F08C0|nr:receptor-type tyrosine-protein phosphatase N2 isoform X2 [Chelonus insularis]
MGRKGGWKGGSSLLLLTVVLIHKQVVQGDGEVGCLFDRSVCSSPKETCFDDAAFGKCIHSLDANDDDVYQYDLEPGELELLRTQMEKLVAEKYEWAHPYTQCIMQNILYSIRYRIKHNSKVCRTLENVDSESSDELIDEKNSEESSDDQGLLPLAVVNFMPTRGHGYGDFANEMYYPPSSFKDHSLSDIEDYTYNPYIIVEQKPERHPTLRFDNNNKKININNNNNDNDEEQETLIFAPEEISKHDDELFDISRKLQKQQRQMEAEKKTVFRSRRQPREKNSRSLGTKLNDYLEFLKESEDITDEADYKKDENLRADINNYQSRKVDNNFENLDKSSLDTLAEMEFLKDDEEWDGLEDDGNNDDSNEKEQEEQKLEKSMENAGEILASLKSNLMPRKMRNEIFTEGGIIEPSNLDNIYEEAFSWNRDLSGFKRPERLDVKKPGPPFSTNNYAFRVQNSISDEDNGDQLNNKEEIRAPYVKKELIAGKDITQLSLDKSPSQNYKNVDLDHVYIQFKEEFHKWSDGKAVVEKVEELLGLAPGDFSNIRVGRAEVTFKVHKNSRDMTAEDVVTQLDNIRGKLQETMHVNIIQAGIGDKIKLPPVLKVVNDEYSMSSTVFGAVVAAGVTAAAATAVMTLVIARKYAKSRAKLAGLATPDPEASKDYQELCRARMHAKQQCEKPEVARVISLSKESESNRSSTSSWGGEEAASLSNMDIATGHMVLSYMEDHLKNKDRLDQEWAAICAYEADPCATTAALQKNNAERNRSGSILPYDHSRVVLNDLRNINNVDYINASTITDHDPRNPAYIATQGPLPQTAADFWQLVWEQGSVVIVMLTRLTEEGRAMCHRYWPEEGSELYHIYEVHLVSEHIWCDDYLVRSFYLKNSTTGETRTVTQFHFLSWPENRIPQSTKALLEFRRKVNKSYRGRSCPIVVHCSDGAGRTGTYCLIDMVLNRMAKGAKEIDIAAALEHIRDQRPGMVATKQQFEFVLVAVTEEVHAILKALPVPPPEKTSTTTVSTTTASTVTTSGAGQ